MKAQIEIVGAIALIAIIALGLGAGAATGLFSPVPVNCDVLPFQQNCFCDEGERKLSLTWIGPFNRNVCDPISVPDPEMAAIVAATSEIAQLFPECDTVGCQIDIVAGSTTIHDVTQGETFGVEDVRVQCSTFGANNQQLDIWWSIYLRLDTMESYTPGNFPPFAPTCTSLDGTIFR